MTVWRNITISCDAGDCDMTYEGDTDENAAVTRQRAARENWLYRRSFAGVAAKDFCPKHATEVQR